jgi:hypothetical protein
MMLLAFWTLLFSLPAAAAPAPPEIYIDCVSQQDPCTATPAVIGTLPTRLEIRGPGKWNCSIQAGAGTPVPCSSAVRLNRPDTVTVVLQSEQDPTRKVGLTVQADLPWNGAARFAALLASGMALLSALGLLVFVESGRRRFEQKRSQWGETVTKRVSDVSTTLKAAPAAVSDDRQLESAAAGKTGRLLQAVRDCFAALEVRVPRAVDESAGRLEELAAEGDARGWENRFAIEARALAKVVIAELDDAAQRSGRPLPPPNGPLRSLLEAAGVQVFEPKQLDKYVPERHRPTAPAESTSMQNRNGCIARTTRRGLIDAETGKVVEKAVVTVFEYRRV